MVYSGARSVEAYGLWFERRWAEWFALISGAIYLPVEIYELRRHVTEIKIAARRWSSTSSSWHLSAGSYDWITWNASHNQITLWRNPRHLYKRVRKLVNRNQTRSTHSTPV